jgi:putative MATE family efflux protein
LAGGKAKPFGSPSSVTPSHSGRYVRPLGGDGRATFGRQLLRSFIKDASPIAHMDAVKHMGELSVGKLLVRYSIPAIVGFLANALYQVVDRVLVGRGVGTEAVAAVTAAFPITIVGLSLALLVGAGTGNRISVLLGQRNVEGAERVLGQGLRLALINGTVLAAVCWLFAEPILLHLCSCPPQLLPMAVPFVRIVSVGQIFLIALISMGNILRVQGRPILGLAVMLSSNIVNVVLAWVAVFILHWGVKGTALATSISQTAGCLTVIALVQGKKSVLHIRGAYMKADRPLAKSILSLGAPIGFMQLLATAVFLAANNGAQNVAGPRGIAVLGVLNTIAMFLIYPPLGVMQSMQPLVGFNKGAGHTDRVRAILVRVLLTTFLMGATFSVLVAVFSGPVARMFSRNDLELIEMVRQGLPWFVVPITLFSVTGTMAHYFLSVHQPRGAALLMLGRQLLAIPLFLLLPRWIGYFGMYLVGPCADLPFAVVGVVIMVRELAKLKKEAARVAPVERAAVAGG